MGFVSLKTTDVMSFKTEGQELIGYLKGTQLNQGKDNNSDVHTIESESGEMISFWGTQIINEQIEKVSIGAYIKIVYLGLQQPKKEGGRAYHNFEVFEDSEKSRVIPSAPTMDSPVANDDFPAAGF